ncbi:MAG: hypothetical protein GX175_01110 [Halanaerobiaceae bacterium]|nr:hypothetical protein [Halanaerobiaceae bacterium]
MEEIQRVEKRELKAEKKKGISVKDVILIGVLLAAGAVLKYFVGSIINIGGVKPNFVIAMYCLGILIIRPNLYEAAAIGILAGAICQFFPGTPYLNFISELAGAVVMCLMIRITMKINSLDLNPAVSTFVSTVVSGTVFVSCLFITLRAESSALVAYIPIVLGTAMINTIIVQGLYIPLKMALNRSS